MKGKRRRRRGGARYLAYRAMFGCADVGSRIKQLFRQRGLKQNLAAQDLNVSESQVSRMLNDKADLPLGAFLYFADQVHEPASSFLPEADAISAEFRKQLKEFIRVGAEHLSIATGPWRTEEPRRVPLLSVAATADNETYDDDEPTLYVLPPDYDGPDMRAFKVVGSSMTGDGIMPGDIVFTRPPKSRRQCDGRIVVAIIHGFRHLKRVRYRGSKVLFESSAPGHPAWPLDDESRGNATILGVVVGRTGSMS